MKRRRLVLLLSLLVGLGLAEGLARTVLIPNESLVWRPLPPFDGLWTREQKAWLTRQGSENDVASATGIFDAELGWTLRPGATAKDGSVHVDLLGRRTLREYPIERAPGTRRIVACGDSFTYADEVADAEAWCARLEQAHSDWEVWNWGVGGYGTDQARLRLEREMVTARRGPVDAVLVGLLIENIGRNVNRYRPRWHSSSLPSAKPRFLLGQHGSLDLLRQPYATREAFVDAVRSGAVLQDLAPHEYWVETYLPPGLGWSALGRLWAARRAYAARDLVPLWSRTEDEPFRVTLELLESFRALAASLEAPHLLVLFFPTREALGERLEGRPAYWRTGVDAARARGLDVLDLAEPLEAAARAAGTSGLRLLYRQSHLSPRGNELVAEAVGAWLEGHLELR